MSLPSRLLGANPSIQVSTLLSGSLSTPSAKQVYIPGAFDSIATYEISTDTASVTFDNIPQTYTHLQIRGIARTTRTDSTSDNINFQFNDDTGANYNFSQLYGNTGTSNSSSAAATGGANVNQTYGSHSSVGTNATANYYGSFIIDILDYTDTTKNKQTRTLAGNGGGSGVERNTTHSYSSWRNTAAITKIKVFSIGSHKQYTHSALYGIRSAS